jgi:acetolactate synthase-1/2/3 large subunit
VKDVRALARTIVEAFYIARTGRPGPVHVDLPKDVLLNEAELAYPSAVRLRGYRPTYEGHIGQIRRAAQRILAAKRPVMLVGGGVVSANAWNEVLAVAELLQIPLTTTLMALGCVPWDHPLSLGMPGMHGLYCANMAIHESDCLVAVGARFDDRVTGKVDEFAPNAEIIQVDVDPTSISKNLRVDVPIVGDARSVLASLRAELERLPSSTNDGIAALRAPWLARIAGWRSAHPLRYVSGTEIVKPQSVIEAISDALPDDAVVVTGVGQHQMWAAQYIRLRRGRRWCTSGGLGAMGYGLPAAIGAQAASPNSTVVCVDGDGSFGMSCIELATLVGARLPVKIVVLNNGSHGMVRQWQELFCGGRHTAVDLWGQPDFARLAEVYGCTGLRVSRPSDVAATIEQALHAPGPVVVDVTVDQEECVFPMVPPGAANKDMLLGNGNTAKPRTPRISVSPAARGPHSG